MNCAPPLTTIIGFTRRLEHSGLDAEQAEYRHAIHHASVMLLSAINDILDFSRMQYGGIALDEIEFQLEEEMEDIVAMHAQLAFEKAIELILLIDSDLPQTWIGDPVRLKQIVNNLLANAVKFYRCGRDRRPHGPARIGGRRGPRGAPVPIGRGGSLWRSACAIPASALRKMKWTSCSSPSARRTPPSTGASAAVVSAWLSAGNWSN